MLEVAAHTLAIDEASLGSPPRLVILRAIGASASGPLLCILGITTRKYALRTAKANEKRTPVRRTFRQTSPSALASFRGVAARIGDPPNLGLRSL